MFEPCSSRLAVSKFYSIAFGDNEMAFIANIAGWQYKTPHF
jgi:hypothetical protein